MAKSTAKAEAMSRQLKDILSNLAKAGVMGATIDEVREAKDANGWPMLFISNGSEAAGQPVVAIRIKGIDAVSKDILGNSLTAFAPHTCEIAWEDLLAATDPMEHVAVAQCAKMGLEIQMKKIATTVAVTEANIDAAAVATEIPADIQFPTKGA